MKFAVLMGGGTNKAPYWVQGFRNEEFFSVEKCLLLCEREGIESLGIAGSGLYYERRADGWWLTSDTAQCDKTHELPSEGRKVSLVLNLSPIGGR